MIKNHLFLKNNIQKRHLNNASLRKLAKKFEDINFEISNDIKNKKKTLNVLDNQFKFNFKIKDLEKFKKFRIIALVGMGGSILGAEAIYNFLEKKNKKKNIFF